MTIERAATVTMNEMKQWWLVKGWKTMKRWWNEFKEDLLFNISMVFMTSGLFILFVGILIIAIKEVFGI